MSLHSNLQLPQLSCEIILSCSMSCSMSLLHTQKPCHDPPLANCCHAQDQNASCLLESYSLHACHLTYGGSAHARRNLLVRQAVLGNLVTRKLVQQLGLLRCKTNILELIRWCTFTGLPSSMTTKHPAQVLALIRPYLLVTSSIALRITMSCDESVQINRNVLSDANHIVLPQWPPEAKHSLFPSFRHNCIC